MALIQADRVKETTATTGTNDLVLAGASTGFQTFANGIGANNQCYYTCTDGSDFEIGLGTLNGAGTTLVRTTVFKSTNSNNKVSWGSGSKDVFVTYPAQKAVILSENDTLVSNSGVPLNQDPVAMSLIFGG
tara:strand:+ start:2841 stop:3233 length:393 start_codon:yes stop_codon:yes gene_type:complete